MSKVLVLYHSSYGHVEQMAKAMAAGVRETGASVDIKRVPETTPLEVAKAAHFNWTSRRRSQPWPSLNITMPSSSGRRPASASCARRWPPFSTRQEASGRAGR